MPRFFIDIKPEKEIILTGENAKHIALSLRMKPDENLTLCDGLGNDYHCRIRTINSTEVVCDVENIEETISEPSVRVTLFQGLPKGDKMETIIQKAVEVGVHEIVPVVMTRSISRPDDKSAKKKVQRWQKIADEAAKQSGRGILPRVRDIENFSSVTQGYDNQAQNIVFYEKGGISLKEILSLKQKNIHIYIGPEGGFEKNEVDTLTSLNASVGTLGKRILRTETAGIVAIGNIMYEYNE